MRTRGIVAVIAAGALLAAAAPALAAKRATIKPNPVKQGKTLTVVASDCFSNGHTAYVEVEIFPKGDRLIKRVRREASGVSSTTKITIKMKPRRFLPDKYLVIVSCLHKFEDGSFKESWSENETVRVKPARI